MDIKRTAGNPGDNGGELALAVCVFVRFRRFRLISIDTHLWSECDKQMVDIEREKHDVRGDISSIDIVCSPHSRSQRPIALTMSGSLLR